MRKKQKEQHKRASRLRKLLIPGIILVLFFVYGKFIQKRSAVEVEVLEGMSIANVEKIELEKNILELVQGYPIEQMASLISEKDPQVAAFLVSIAKKESNWGKRVPRYQGRDCFNYWGYKGPNRIGSGGHSCFSTRQEAVNIVAKRIETLVHKKNLDTPQKMIVWKCGSSCAGHSPFGVSKWISDVAYYYQKVHNKK